VKLIYLTRNEINDARWDKCIDTSVNNSLFAYSWYLDKVSPGWEALADEQYHTVMPLTFASHNGKKYVSQPLYTPSLGIFSNHLILPAILNQFYTEVENRFQSVKLVLNKMNPVDCFPVGKISFTSFWEKDLIQTYERLKAEYSYIALTGISAFHSAGFKIAHNAPVTDLQQFWALNTDCSPVKYNENNIRIFRQLMNELIQRNAGAISIAYNSRKQPCAIIAWAWAQHKISIIHQMVNAEGIEAYALQALIDNIIHQQAEKAVTLSIPVLQKNCPADLSLMGFASYPYPTLIIENRNLFLRLLSGKK
jgi:hypothetical protein